MRTRRLGSEGPEISTVGFGTWTVAGPWAYSWGEVDDEESIAAIRHAVESGVNWIDTAAAYGLGHAEEVVGRALAPYRAGEDVYVFTKCGMSWYRTAPELENDLRPESIRFECEQSLRRLGVERLDLYQLHWPDPVTGTALEDSWATMLELIAEGKVRWGGVSNFTPEQLGRCERVRRVDSLQNPLSLLDRGSRREAIPWCRDHATRPVSPARHPLREDGLSASPAERPMSSGAGVLVYSPLASGILAGSVDRARRAAFPENDWRKRGREFQEPRFSAALEFVERLRPIAEWLDVTLAALAVAWTLAVPGVTAAIAGARRANQVDGWLAAADLDLDAETLEEIEQALEETCAGTDELPLPQPVTPRFWVR